MDGRRRRYLPCKSRKGPPDLLFASHSPTDRRPPEARGNPGAIEMSLAKKKGGALLEVGLPSSLSWTWELGRKDG